MNGAIAIATGGTIVVIATIAGTGGIGGTTTTATETPGR